MNTSKGSEMMTSESNRATVLLFCECISRRDYAGMAQLVTSDATWWVIGRPDYAPRGGLHRVTDVLQFMSDFLGPLDEFMFTVDGSIAEGDRIAIEATSSGRQGTARYKNVYLMRFQLREERIESIREFFDAYELIDYRKQLETNRIDALKHDDGAVKL
jgi:ketosteroid isomerase-like protein